MPLIPEGIHPLTRERHSKVAVTTSLENTDRILLSSPGDDPIPLCPGQRLVVRGDARKVEVSGAGQRYEVTPL